MNNSNTSDTIRLDNLTIGYKTHDGIRTVAKDINASIKSGKLTCLVGTNGIGKSTLLRTLSGFQPRLGGSIVINGSELSGYTPRDLSRIVSVVLTSRPSSINFTVEEIVALGRTPYTGFWGTLNDADKEIVSESIRLAGISHLAKRNGEVIMPLANTQLHINDNVLVVTMADEIPSIEILLGKKIETDWNKKKIDWNAIDAQVESRVIVLSRRVLNGKHLGQLHLRDTYGVNVSRIQRGDIKLLATDDIRLQYGDRVTVVGAPEDINHVEGFLGNAVQTLNEPNLAAIFLGIMLGLALGTIPLSLPGMSAPVRLGIAGGPIIMGILVGSLGSRAHFISYTTPSASLMLRKLGLSLYLACLGLEAGYQFFETVVRPEGLLWIGIGFALTVVPVLIIGAAALLTRKYDFGTICGILCGSMANPMALSYANDTLKGDSASISYTSVYPLGMFVRVVIAQVLVMFLV